MISNIKNTFFILLILWVPLSSVIAQKKNKTGHEFYEHDIYYGYITVDTVLDSIARDFWTETYQQDIFKSGLVSQTDIFPLYFDALGHLYPDISELAEVAKHNSAFTFTPRSFNGSRAYPFSVRLAEILSHKSTKAFKPSGQHPINVTSASLALIVSNSKNRAILESYLANGNPSSDIKRLVEASRVFTKQIENTITKNSLPEKKLFDAAWAIPQYAKVASDLSKVINEGEYDKVIFFFAGYNMPYAMQAVQAEKLVAYLKYLDPNTKYLVVASFWPSGGYNKRPDVWTKDAKTSSAWNWFYFLNKAYYVGYGLRAFINEIDFKKLENNPRFYAMAHSGGNSILATAIADFDFGKDYSNFKYEDKGEKYNGVVADSCTLCNWQCGKGNFSQKDWTDLSRSYPRIPTNINIFHSAPAISNHHTLALENQSVKPMTFGSLNSLDPLLSKPFLKRLFKPNRRAYALGSTAFGQNINAATEGAERISYKHTVDLMQSSHNVLVYWEDSRFQTLFKEFLEF